MDTTNPFKRLAAAVVILAMTVCALPALAGGRTLQIKGSDTMVNLMSNMAEGFMKAHPDIAVAVDGGGSGTGIAAMIDGTIDICSSSRSFKPDELEQAKGKSINPVGTIIGLDGISMMVNKSNTVTELTLDQLRQIYTSAVTNWRDLGGPDRTITVLSRESVSGTYAYFQEHVLKGAAYAASATQLPSTAAITKAVSDDPGAIGYGGIAYAEHAPVKTIKVRKTADSEAIPPTMETVLNATYPISRPLYLYTNGTPSGDVKTFIDFCLSPDGQKIVNDTGYIRVESN